jgi:AcrR family transcriptional regulator
MAVDTFASGALRPKQARSQRYLERLVSCAIDIINTEGEDALTMTVLAQQAGLSTGGIYRRFADKSDLEAFLKDYYLTHFEIEAKEALERPAENLSGVVKTLFDVHVKRINKHENMWRFIVNSYRNPAVRVPRGVRTHRLIEQYFCDAGIVHKKEIAHKDPEGALRIAFQLAFGMITLRLRVAGPTPPIFGGANLALEAERAIYAYLTTPTAAQAKHAGRNLRRK